MGKPAPGGYTVSSVLCTCTWKCCYLLAIGRNLIGDGLQMSRGRWLRMVDRMRRERRSICTVVLVCGVGRMHPGLAGLEFFRVRFSGG